MSYYEISLNKRYKIPKDIRIIHHNSKVIVIAPLTANWIILESDSQLKVFDFFRAGRSLKEALDNTQLSHEDVNFVVTQLEARRLCEKKVHKTSDDKRGLHLYLTNKCNLSCPHCYMFSGRAKNNELTTKEIINLICDYKKIANGTRLTLSGGEPTIHADFSTIVKTASEMGLEVNVLTNGTSLTAQKIKDLAKYISSVQISIDGFSEESDSIIRGKGHFKQALDAVDAFICCDVETSVAVTPSLDSLRNHIDEYVLFARNLSMKYVHKNFRIKFAEGLSYGREINPTDSENEEYARIIKYLQDQIYGDEYGLIHFVEIMRNNIVMDNCMFGVFAVTSDGDVYFCPEISKLSPIANIRTSDFKEIYRKSKAAEIATSITKLKPCNECALRYICGGGCRITEFPELAARKSFEDINYEDIPPRICDKKIKDKFYDLMIRSNEYLYVPLDES